jgi:hypothetical protein
MSEGLISGDFFEEDEPAEQSHAIINRPPDAVNTPPSGAEDAAMFNRETATRLEDLPHRYLGAPNPGNGGRECCSTCGQAFDEVRHVSWENAQIDSRERAAAAPQWEKGS